MEVDTSSPSTAFLLRHRKAFLGACCAAAVGYGAYKVYNSESAQALRKFQTALANYSDALAKASSTTSLLASDLHAYLNSDSEEVPQSLKQVCRLLQSNELQSSLSDTVSTVVRSVVASSCSAASPTDSSAPSFTDKLLEAVFSSRGHSLLGMAIGVAAKNVTGTFCEYLEKMQNAPSSSDSFSPSAILGLLASEQGEKVMSCLITSSIQTAVHSYVDAYRGYNMYEDMVASITKQGHRDAITDIMTRVTVAFCKEVAAVYRRSKAVPVNCSSSQKSVNGAEGVVICGDPISMRASAGAAAESVLSKPSLANSRGGGAASTSRWTGSSDSSANDIVMKLNHRSPAPAQAEWLQDVVSLLKDRDVRALAVEVVSSATREATRGTIETLLGGLQSSRQEGGIVVTTSTNLAMCRVYAFMSLSIALFMYAVSPRTIDL